MMLKSVNSLFPKIIRLRMDQIAQKCCHHQTPVSTPTYEEAVRKLNLLQSNALVLAQIRKEREKILHYNITHVEECLNKIGVDIDDLDKLKVIHISGTKGKGSTSAFCESILRNKGFRTGFYSSPHLIVVRERIRINGKPISEELFTSYFWHVYSNLWEQKKSEADMPGYFKFLTVMAYYVFLKEKVDVAIIEVGIGGQYDNTNVIRRPVLCGVTSLGLDHESILGDTVEKIAWQKAGIFKPSVPAFTVPQPQEALAVLAERAQDIGNPLYVVPPLEMYDWGNKPKMLGIAGAVQSINASLAVQLSVAWIDLTKGNFKLKTVDKIKDNCKNETLLGETELKILRPFRITGSVATGLQECSWPGRSQIIRKNSVLYFLDGAHTIDSIQVCKQWFHESSKKEEFKISGSIIRVLVFNLMGERNAETLLKLFIGSNINLVIFCPNFVHISHHQASDQNAVASPWNLQMDRCKHNNYLWQTLVREEIKKKLITNHYDEKFANHKDEKTPNDELTNNYFKLSSYVPSVVFPCICDTIKWLSQGMDPRTLPSDVNDVPAFPDHFVQADEIHVLVAGSLHLVGGFLGSLLPEIIQDKNDTSESRLNKSERSIQFVETRWCAPGTP